MTVTITFNNFLEAAEAAFAHGHAGYIVSMRREAGAWIVEYSI